MWIFGRFSGLQVADINYLPGFRRKSFIKCNDDCESALKVVVQTKIGIWIMNIWGCGRGGMAASLPKPLATFLFLSSHYCYCCYYFGFSFLPNDIRSPYAYALVPTIRDNLFNVFSVRTRWTYVQFVASLFNIAHGLRVYFCTLLLSSSHCCCLLL